MVHPPLRGALHKPSFRQSCRSAKCTVHRNYPFYSVLSWDINLLLPCSYPAASSKGSSAFQWGKAAPSQPGNHIPASPQSQFLTLLLGYHLTPLACGVTQRGNGKFLTFRSCCEGGGTWISTISSSHHLPCLRLGEIETEFFSTSLKIHHWGEDISLPPNLGIASLFTLEFFPEPKKPRECHRAGKDSLLLQCWCSLCWFQNPPFFPELWAAHTLS